MKLVLMLRSRRGNYPLHQSPLFKLRNKRKLASEFNLTLRELNSLLERNDNYRVFVLNQGKKKRRVEVPKSKLERIHRRLFHLLSRIYPPDYLQSGVQGRSYITNAKQHKNNSVLYKLDIENFYPSTKRWHIYNFFCNTMKCSSDVAGLLAKIISVEGHLPTGSCLSQIMGFYAHFNMFNALNKLAESNNLTMTCYVDDIVFSGVKVSKLFQYKAKKIIKKSQLSSHPEKEKLFYGVKPRVVTGVVISGAILKVPNKQHLKIKDSLAELRLLEPASLEKENLRRQVIGRIVSASQIEPKLMKHKTRLS